MPKEGPPISLDKAVALSLGDMDQPVITAYRLGLFLWRLHHAGQYQGQRLNVLKDIPEGGDFARMVAKLEEAGVLQEGKGFPRRSVYHVLGRERGAPEDVACAVDPFAYVSHLSAMAYHGLTDRIPQMLFLSSPAPPKWRAFARERMAKDLGESFSAYHQSGLPRLHRIEFSKIARYTVNRYASLHPGAFKLVEGRSRRVATIGRTFLDMLRNPELCGGIRHVLDVFEEFGQRYLELIADEVDRHGKNIDKVRAGYVLEEHCRLNSERFEPWRRLVQRGGSRKLDPAGEYRETYSARWCLSLNID
ncbi:MAG: hypothetical protein AB1641_31680 [Thermodesulfobacteriota bacterium]